MTPEHFSNGWKKCVKSFQWLEKWLKKFPMIGKMAEKVSNDWKKRMDRVGAALLWFIYSL